MRKSLRAVLPPAVALPLALALAAALAASGATAQNISGLVIDEATESPVEGARVVLMDDDERPRGETFSDSEGQFWMEVPRTGTWWLAITSIGYEPVVSAPIEARVGDYIEVEVYLTVAAVPIEEPVVVTGRMEHLNSDIQGFYDRMEQSERAGVGKFLARRDIERMRPLEPSDLLRTMHGVRVVQGARGRGKALRMTGGTCTPAIFIDGTQINRINVGDSIDDYLTVHAIEGIEVYRGSQQVGRFNDGRGCGLVLVWTRRGHVEPGGSGGWTRLVIGTALLLGLFLLR